MDVLYDQQGLAFEWDSGKALANLEKHGISFEEATEAFLDPFHQGGDASENLESRQFVIGYSINQHLLLVIHTERSDRIRVISARPATRSERHIYEQA